MAKLAVLGALLAALIALASATTYTTVVTTTVDEENPQQSCQMEVQQMQMTNCMQYMQSKMMKSPYKASFLRSAVANPGSYQEEHLEGCCNELRSVRSSCRCDAMRHMVRQMQQQMQHGMDEEKQQMMKETVKALPQMCSMSSPTQCPFPAVFV